MKRLLLTFLALGLLAGRGAVAAEVSATLEPAQVSVGETAELTVTVSGSQSAEPSIPNIPGLDIAHVGQSTQIQIINGSMTASNVQTYEVTPQRAGNFTIPPIEAGGARSRPLVLQVTGNGSGSSSGGTSSNSSGNATLPPPNVPMPATDNTAPGNTRFGYIQVAVPKSQLYVGELVPLDISVFVPAGMQAQLEGPPTLTNNGLALNPLSDKPEQHMRIVNRKQYDVLTWHAAVTAIKPGDFSLDLEMPLVVVVREQSHRQRTGNDLFDDFFDDAFTARPVRKEVKLSNEPVSLTVQELPTAHRPADFGGAIGEFDLHASAAPAKVTAGDPITLHLDISGTGDFDRASSSMVAAGNGWKTYPPKSTFQAEDSASYKGSKTFEQLIIPEDDGVKEIPALRFSFFDPKTGQYETRTTAPIPVTVTGAAVPAPLTASNAAPGAAGAPAPTPQDLVPNKVEPGHFVATLQPVFLNPWFVAVQGLPLCALAGGLLFLRRRQRLAADPRHARASAAERAIAVQLAGMDQAMRQHASGEFFLCARSALQQRLGERWNVRPETITLAEIESRMNGAGDGIRPIFEMADQASYSGQNLGDADFRQWKEFVVGQLEALENAS